MLKQYLRGMKQVFAASYSTLDAAALATYIAIAYGLQNVHCNFLVRGVGDTYTVNSAAGHFILRIYRRGVRTLPQIQAEAELLVALRNQGVSVSYPIASLNGRHLQEFEAVEGTSYAMLFTYAAGIAVNILSENQLISLGYEMAKFHNVSANIQLNGSRWQFDNETTLIKPLKAVEYAFKGEEESYGWLQTAVVTVQQKLEATDASLVSKGYCHFDFLPKNFHFEGDMVTLFDFDFFGYGWLVNDMMTFWVHLCMDVHFNRLTQDAADKALAILVKAYREYRPLSGGELATIPYLSLGFWVFYMGFHATHDQFYPLLQPATLKLRTNFLKGLTEKYWTDETIAKLEML